MDFDMLGIFLVGMIEQLILLVIVICVIALVRRKKWAVFAVVGLVLFWAVGFLGMNVVKYSEKKTALDEERTRIRKLHLLEMEQRPGAIKEVKTHVRYGDSHRSFPIAVNSNIKKSVATKNKVYKVWDKGIDEHFVIDRYASLDRGILALRKRLVSLIQQKLADMKEPAWVLHFVVYNPDDVFTFVHKDLFGEEFAKLNGLKHVYFKIISTNDRSDISVDATMENTAVEVKDKPAGIKVVLEFAKKQAANSKHKKSCPSRDVEYHLSGVLDFKGGKQTLRVIAADKEWLDDLEGYVAGRWPGQKIIVGRLKPRN